jgi:predicted membrane-bound spermidine synthase
VPLKYAMPELPQPAVTPFLPAILKYKDVKKITVVDLDHEITDIAIKNRFLKELNKESFTNNKVKIINEEEFNRLLK